MYINGQITDRAGGSLPNANIYFSNKAGTITAAAIGTSADMDGNYSIVGDGQYLTASYTGYDKQTIPATTGHHDFSLTSGINLSEVVIKGTMLWPRILGGIIILLFAAYLYKKLKK